MRFIDEARVTVTGGRGGDGAVNWRREKYEPRGGPDGGNGGNGGAVIFQADPALNTLIDFSFNPLLLAENGIPGGPQSLDGRAGRDRVAAVPVGTQVFLNDELVADLSVPGALWVAARGGKGGKGNAWFKSSRNRAPQHATPGVPGDSRELRLVLKSVADVGLVGLPNAGKSSLVRAISQATPRVGDYPFTTLRPTLGTVFVADGKSFVIADIPGLIPGAHEGKGLGLQFLRHIERTTVLVHVVDLTQDHELGEIPEPESPAAQTRLSDYSLRQYRSLENELQQFSPELLLRPRLVVFSKADVPLVRAGFRAARPGFHELGLETLLVSSHTGEGLDELKGTLFALVSEGLPSSPGAS
ncbi:MAG: GTPase ObgE [Bdellovibrionales bacterium]|nr:GTPase ObgE [Bdellovibrionales bacterium]